jgi:hypothetical protein
MLSAMVQYSFVRGYKRFGWTSCLYIQGTENKQQEAGGNHVTRSSDNRRNGLL